MRQYSVEALELNELEKLNRSSNEMDSECDMEESFPYHLSFPGPKHAAGKSLHYSSKVPSATGGTGAINTGVLGDYKLKLINKAFIDF